MDEIMPEITVQQAVDRIAKELMEMADGAEKPPEVDLEVEWLDICTIAHRAWVPRIKIHASTVKTVCIYDL